MISSASQTLVFAEDIAEEGTILLRGPLGSSKSGFFYNTLVAPFPTHTCTHFLRFYQGFGCVKYWQMEINLPNSPKFSPARILRYTITPKKNIQMYVDLSHLNHYVKRERYQSPTPVEAVTDIAASNTKYFTILDTI